MRRLGIVIAVALAAGLAGCASTSHRPARRSSATAVPTACSAAARRAVANLAGGRAVTATAYSPPDGSSGCRLQTAPKTGRRVSVDLRVDTLPQPFARLDREQVETTQTALWSHSGATLPAPVAGVGELAYWFPSQSRLLATDGTRLVSIRVTGGALERARRLGLARRIGRAVLAGR